MTRLSDKAMLARLNICQWTARKYDKKVRNGADVSADDLRKDQGLRESVAQECDAILRDMQSAFGG